MSAWVLFLFGLDESGGKAGNSARLRTGGRTVGRVGLINTCVSSPWISCVDWTKAIGTIDTVAHQSAVEVRWRRVGGIGGALMECW